MDDFAYRVALEMYKLCPVIYSPYSLAHLSKVNHCLEKETSSAFPIRRRGLGPGGSGSPRGERCFSVRTTATAKLARARMS